MHLCVALLTYATRTSTKLNNSVTFGLSFLALKCEIHWHTAAAGREGETPMRAFSDAEPSVCICQFGYHDFLQWVIHFSRRKSSSISCIPMAEWQMRFKKISKSLCGEFGVRNAVAHRATMFYSTCPAIKLFASNDQILLMSNLIHRTYSPMTLR